VRISGDYSPVDTTSFTANGYVYLSNTPGEISSVPGTITSIVGYAITIGINGCISIKCVTPSSTSNIAVKNTSGVAILQGQVVRRTGLVQPQQIPSIALASAAAASTATVLGIALTNIANGAIGQVSISGEYSPINTTGFIVNGYVYLSNTPGEISAVPGTITSIIGYATTIGVNGCISITCVVPTPCNPGGSTGTQGATGAGGGGVTGIQGETGICCGDTGIQGETGIQGVPGDPGAPGTQGETGISGEGGTGLAGETGVQGLGNTRNNRIRW
jgi:hypothetical protein